MRPHDRLMVTSPGKHKDDVHAPRCDPGSDGDSLLLAFPDDGLEAPHVGLDLDEHDVLTAHES